MTAVRAPSEAPVKMLGAASRHLVPAIAALLVVASTSTTSLARARRREEPSSEQVVEAIQRADMHALIGDWRGALVELHHAGRGPLARAARIAVGHQVRPGGVLRLDEEALGRVRGLDVEASVFETFGHVLGIAGAVVGGGTLVFGSLLILANDGRVSESLGIAMASFGGGALVAAALGIVFHVVAGGRRSELRNLLETSASARGAHVSGHLAKSAGLVLRL